MDQGSVVWLKIPFSDYSGAKIRPAVIISHTLYNKRQEDVVVCSLSSKIKRDSCSVIVDNKNLSQGSIPLKSRVRVDNLFSIDKRFVGGPFAVLSDKTFDTVIRKITTLIKRR